MKGTAATASAHPHSSLICGLIATAILLTSLLVGLFTSPAAHAASAADQGAQMKVDVQVLKALEAVDALDAAILGQDAEAFANLLTPKSW